MVKKQRSALRWVWLSLGVVLLDQLSKYLAVKHLVLNAPLAVFPGFNLTLVYNTGAAFSLLRDAGGWQRWLFVALAVAIAVFILIWLWRLPVRRNWLGCALALVLGGALGNLWDRVSLGYVIDFIDLYYAHWHWPAFNLADSAITAGAIMLVIDTFWFDRAEVTMDAARPRGG
jgi:signal peptidase II